MDAMNLGANFYTKKGGSPREKIQGSRRPDPLGGTAGRSRNCIEQENCSFDHINEESPLAITVFDNQLCCTYANGKFRTAFPEIKEVIGVGIHDFFPDIPRSMEQEVDGAFVARDIRWIFRRVVDPGEEFFLVVYGFPESDDMSGQGMP